MRLLKAKISSYKSIVDTELTVDPRVTVLVGPNEGGKTNILKALEAFNQDNPFTEDPVCQFSPAYREGQFPEVQLLFGEFSEAEKEGVIDAWRRATGQRKRKLTASIPGADEQTSAVEPSEQPAEVAKSEEVPQPKMTSLPFPEKFQRLTITRQGNDLEDHFIHLDEQEITLPDPRPESAFKTEILRLLPRFLYFEDISLLRGEIELDDLLGEEPAFQTERNLLKLGGITNLEILTGSARRRDVAIQNAQRRITERLRRYWTQDPSREFSISVDKNSLRIRISDSTGVFDFPEDRSLGSRWFVSFYINFVSRIEGSPDRAILLFDEPGIHIHPRGQRDLLPIFEELASKYQLIYTCHLPFLINRNFPARIRVVQKKGREGTVVNNKPHENRWKAIRSAVGLLAADSFIIGDTCLIVEGVSDHIYVAGLSQFLAELGLPFLDMNQVGIIPAPSASETIAPARFCQAEKIPVAVILDSDNQGNQAAEALAKDGFIMKTQVIRVNDALLAPNEQRRTLEDLLPQDRLLDAVNRCYKLRINSFSAISAQDLEASKMGEDAKPVPVVNAFSRIFQAKRYGDFDKRLVGEHFVNDLPRASTLEPSELARLKRDFEDIGRLFATARETLRRLASEGTT